MIKAFLGEIDCDKYLELCASLQVEDAPAWGALKTGGAYQISHTSDVRGFIKTAAETVNLHSLSASDFVRIMDGDVGTWVLLVVPHQLSWEHMAEPFTKASLQFLDYEDMSFGIMVCTQSNDKHCRQVAGNQPVILVQHKDKRHAFNGRVDGQQLVEFVQLIRNSAELEISEQKILEISDVSSREHIWLVAFLPAHCGQLCDDLTHEMRIVANKLRPLESVRVGVLQCAQYSGGFCGNVRAATARLYPVRERHHYSVNLQHLSEAVYILEWALEYIDDSVQKLNWHTFTKKVIAEELNPTRGKKPWLVYFHSPRCYRCYEMYPDFAIAGMKLKNAVHLGKVNCVTERGLCQHEQITSYPSLKLYLGRNQHHRFSSVINIPVRDHTSLLADITPHIMEYDRNLLAGVHDHRSFHVHDEF